MHTLGICHHEITEQGTYEIVVVSHATIQNFPKNDVILKNNGL